MTYSYCRHRFTTLKRWQSGDKWYVIQHCRWCDKWQRKTIEISDKAMATQPKLVNEVYKVNDLGVKKMGEVKDSDRGFNKGDRRDNGFGRGLGASQDVSEPSNSPPETDRNLDQ